VQDRCEIENGHFGEYTMRVCIFRVRCTLLAGISIVYLNFGFLRVEYTLRVCIWIFENSMNFTKKKQTLPRVLGSVCIGIV
jgi:hypothetical protein